MITQLLSGGGQDPAYRLALFLTSPNQPWLGDFIFMDQQLISIVMPLYNAEPYLEACVDSILAQTHAQWELIVCDDFSNDASHAIIQSYAERDSRIYLLSNERKGIVPALQMAYAQSSGAFISRMDADDIMPKDKLATLLALAREHPEAQVFTGQVAYFAEGDVVKQGYKAYEQWLNALNRNEAWWNEIYKECPVASPNWLMRREDFERIGAFSSETYPEDYDLVFRMKAGAYMVKASATITHLWRDHAARASKNDPNYADNRFLPLKWKWWMYSDRKVDQPLIIWGAGKKGKDLAKLVLASQIPFHWITNNSKKWGKECYGIIWEKPWELSGLANAQIISMVSSPAELVALKEGLTNCDLFSFC